MALTMKTIRAEGIIAPDGSLILLAPALLPFHPGERVTLNISLQSEEALAPSATVLHTILRYDPNFDMVAPPDRWSVSAQ